MTPVHRDRYLTCPDRDCGGLAEPEQDGDLAYHVCMCCGFEFMYQRVDRNAKTCAAGFTREEVTGQLPLFQIGHRNADPS